MTKLSEKEEIRLAIIEYKEAKGISQNALALQINGVSSAILSHIGAGKFDGISDEIFRKIKNKLSEITRVGLFNTTAFDTGLRVCKSAQENHFMLGLIAEAGTGKTTLLTSYSMRKNVFYLEYNHTMKPRQFYVCLLREMGIDFESNLYEMLNMIADELNSMENPLIIIDEAGKMVPAMILSLHVLRNKTMKGCGILLAGVPSFRENLKKFARKGKEGYAEFLSRIGQWQELDILSRIEIKAICEANGITDAETLKEMYKKNRFRALQDAIIFHKIENQTNHD